MEIRQKTNEGGLFSEIVVSCCVLSLFAVAAAVVYRSLDRQTLDQTNQRCQEERTGRIRAEVKLRTVQKELQQLKLERLRKQETRTEEDVASHLLLLRCIGTVESPFTKRMGTPRQSQLVPSSRGIIHFSCQSAALDGIDAYSHLWIIFGFHANTNIQAEGKTQKTKIRPPRAGGQKVGQLATRSPHRPNAIGLSLVQLQSWDSSAKQLHVVGLDLVNGTPVYDVKPCVPWDIPNFYHSKMISSVFVDMGSHGSGFRVPDWVKESDVFPEISFTDVALQQLRDIVVNGQLAPLYTSQNNGEETAACAIKEVLAQDPRSSHKGLKRNARGTASDNGESYSMLFGNCQVFFHIRSSTLVEVVNVLKFETASMPFVDGVPLVFSGAKA